MRGLVEVGKRPRVMHGVAGVFGVFLGIWGAWWFIFLNRQKWIVEIFKPQMNTDKRRQMMTWLEKLCVPLRPLRLKIIF